MNIKNTYHNKTVGQFGESAAEDYLISKGYKIIGKNVKIGYSELDIISVIDNKTVFVEVKTRNDTEYFNEAEFSINKNKLKSLKRGIVKYSILEKINLNNIRLDLIVLCLDNFNKPLKLKHYRDIF